MANEKLRFFQGPKAKWPAANLVNEAVYFVYDETAKKGELYLVKNGEAIRIDNDDLTKAVSDVTAVEEDGVKKIKVTYNDGSTPGYITLDNLLSDARKSAIDSTITSTKVKSYDDHIAAGDIHVTADQKTEWSDKQDKIADVANVSVSTLSGTTLSFNGVKQTGGQIGTGTAGVSLEFASAPTSDNKVVTQAELSAMGDVMHFAGAGTTLPTKPAKGDVYVFTGDSGDYKAGQEVVWTGTAWEVIGDQNNTVTSINGKKGAIIVNGEEGVLTVSGESNTQTISIVENGITKSKLVQEIQDSLDLADSSVQSVDKATGETLITVDNTDTKNPKISSTEALTSAVGKANSSVQAIKLNGGTAIQPTDGIVDLPIPAANDGALKISINGGTAASKFTANQSTDSTLSFATGTTNGTIKVDDTEVAVAGLTDVAFATVDNSSIKLTNGVLSAKSKVKGNETGATAVVVDPIVFDTTNTNITVDSTSGDISMEWGTF